jgi:hypoxanthine phosphoribosyltransferase
MVDNSYPIQDFENRCIVVKNSDFLAPDRFVIPQKHQRYVSHVVLSRGLILDRIEKLAYEIANDYRDQEVYLLIVLKGAVLFGTYLQEKIYEQSKKDDGNNIHIYLNYVQLISYHNNTSTGSVKILDSETLVKMKNKNVVIVEDIYDSGLCMDQFLKYLRTFEPADIKTCVLLQKMNKKNLDYGLKIDYLGFLIPNLFVIGFGNDYNEEFRDLNHLCIINQEGIEKLRK